MLILPFTDIPDNTHHVKEPNSTYVTHADQYRMSWATIIERSHPNWDALTGCFTDDSQPTDTFGVAGLESQEHSVLWIGPADVIARFQADPVAIPWSEFNQQGIWGDRWPNGDAWYELIPRTTWTPDSQGVVTEYPFEDGNGSVVVYEMLGRPALLSPGVSESPEGLTPLVTFHCRRCHEESGSHDRYMSASPQDRRTVCLKARQHMRPGQCRGAEANARNDRMVAVVREVISKRPVTGSTEGLYAAQCQIKDPNPNSIMASSSCAEVREARTHTDRHRTTVRG